jgi:hypothetical protein
MGGVESIKELGLIEPVVLKSGEGNVMYSAMIRRRRKKPQRRNKRPRLPLRGAVYRGGDRGK